MIWLKIMGDINYAYVDATFMHQICNISCQYFWTRSTDKFISVIGKSSQILIVIALFRLIVVVKLFNCSAFTLKNFWLIKLNSWNTLKNLHSSRFWIFDIHYRCFWMLNSLSIKSLRVEKEYLKKSFWIKCLTWLF